MWNKLALAVLMMVALGSCSRRPDIPGDPKARLSEYISKSFAVNGPGDRAALLSYLSGDAKIRLEAWSDDQFRQAFMNAKRQFLKLSFKEIKPINADEVSITYEVEFLDKGKGNQAKVTNKKLAQMVQVQGSWFVSDVHNIKELVEYQNEMSLP